MLGRGAAVVVSVLLCEAGAFAPPGAAATRAPGPARSGIVASKAQRPQNGVIEEGLLTNLALSTLAVGALAAALGAGRRRVRTSATQRAASRSRLIRQPKGGTQAYQFLPSLYPPMLVDQKILEEQGPVEKRVWTEGKRPTTLEEIEALTIEDVPTDWKPYYSPGMIIRDELMRRIREVLDETYCLVIFNFDGITHAAMGEIRKSFPKNVVVRQLVNTLVRRAMQDTPWEALVPELKGQNMYVFVKDEVDLRETIKTIDKIAGDKKLEAVIEKRQRWLNSKDSTLTDLRRVRGSMLRDDWTVMLQEETLKLKDFPTKLELIAQIAGGIKQIPTKLARCSKQLPQKLAVGTKKIVEKMEEEGKATVGDLV